MLLNNVELNWSKLDPNSPDMGFDKKSPQYSIGVVTRNKADYEAYKKAGLNFKPIEENGQVIYTATIKKKIYKDDSGKNATLPPVVVDSQLQPLDGKKIGNGSIGNVQIKFKDYDYMGKKGKSVQLMAIQVTKLVEYTGGSNNLEFSPINTATAQI